MRGASFRSLEKPVSLDYYLARAADARAEADAATLANVREQCLRCEAVWNDMAARVAETEAMRRRNKAPAVTCEADSAIA